MGTRGAFGFYRNGVDKITYNHFDSYPEALGVSILRFCHNTSVERMNEIFDNIQLVDEFLSKPTPEQQNECEKYLDLSVSSQSPEDWYCLLREAQGGLDAWAEGLKYMIDSRDFLKDSLFCEWAYIINLTTNELEVYRGFQKEPDEDNRYYTPQPLSAPGYYSCKLIATLPLDDLLSEELFLQYFGIIKAREEE